MGLIGTISSQRITSKKFLHVKEVAKKVGVHPETIKRWINQRKVKVTWGRDRRKWVYIDKDDVKKLKKYAVSIEVHS